MEVIDRIEWAMLSGSRPRVAGANARLNIHGVRVETPTVRITTSSGASGFGYSRLTRESAEQLIGTKVDTLFEPELRVPARFHEIEFPVWDLVAKTSGVPVYRLIAPADTDSLEVPCYDTTLLIDDLHLSDDDAACDLMASEALEGVARNHTAFKIKVGRGAMHMNVEDGMRRDIRVTHAIRDAVGDDATIMLDANNGLNVNLTETLVVETAGANVYWMEEPFHEDGALYAILKERLSKRGIDTLIADGESSYTDRLLEWIRDGLIDVAQHDLRSVGFSGWLDLGPKVDACGARSAPHHWGRFYDNFTAAHLAAAIEGFDYIEYDEATVPGIDSSNYRVKSGHVVVPDLPGFGLLLDDEYFIKAVAESGFSINSHVT